MIRLLAVLLAVAAARSEARAAETIPVRGGAVALVARPGRLAQQLRRELRASGFEVVAIDAAAVTSEALDTAGVTRAVVVEPSADRVRVVRRARDGLAWTAELPLDAERQDDLAWRRVSLAVVEHLRQPPPPERAPPVAVPAPLPVEATAAAAAPAPPPPRARPWSLGAATSINLGGASGESTGHLQLVGETAVGGPLLASVRVHWPLLGAQLHLPDRRVRLWTWGVGSGLRVRLPGLGALQPLLGATGGLRLVLTDTDWFDPRQSRVAMTPALCAGAFAGARYTVVPLVHVDLELGSEWSRPIADPVTVYVREATSARATRVALGVVFEY